MTTAKMRVPDFFIVGAAKSGTTSLSYYLRQHPDIFIPPRELDFFSSDLCLSRDFQTKEQYFSYFSNVAPEILVGEKSVSYLYSRRAANEIKAICPHARIIIILRNPVDVIDSLHSHLVRIGYEDIYDLECALAEEGKRNQGVRIPKNTPRPALLLYRQVVKFTEQVRRYCDSFGMENVKVILYEDLKNTTSEIYRDTLTFLGMNDTWCPDFSIKNSNWNVRRRTLHRALTRMFVRPPLSAVKLARLVLPLRVRQPLRGMLLQLNLESGPRGHRYLRSQSAQDASAVSQSRQPCFSR